MAKIIAISNHKGGVGKTTSVVNIGAGVSLLGKKVLLIDLDPQANLTQSLGIQEAEETIYGALKGKYELPIMTISDNLDLVASTLDLSGAEMELASEPGREYLLLEIIENKCDAYDYVFIDCPPSLSLLTINAFTAAHEIIIPIQAHYLAIKGLTKIIEVVETVKRRLNRQLKISGVFVTQYDRRKILHRDVAETIKTYFHEKMFNTKIRDNIVLAEAPSQGMDVFQYNAKSYGAEDYMNLCREILARESQQV